KAKFSNIPKDGSVEVSFKKEPNYSKVSERPQRVSLQFKTKNAKEIGEAYVMVVVRKAVKKEIEVDQKVIDTSLMESNGQKWVEGQSIRPATVTSLLDGANILPEIEGLPKGLKFDGKTISGTPERSDEGWPADGSGFKTIKLKFKAEKGDKILVRTVEYWLYRDKDRDGISDDEDIDQGEKFTPISSNRQPIIVEGKAPSLEDYKAKFSNIPKDGSVEVSFKKEPDYSKVSDRPQRVYLQFKSKYSKQVGEAYVMVIVKKAVKKENQEVRSLNQKAKKKKEEIKENSIKKTKEKNSNSQPVDNKKDTKENESKTKSSNKDLETKSSNKDLEKSEKKSDFENTQNSENSNLPPLEIKKESPVIEDENDSDKKVQ
ncbi:MAG: FMN-binding protein, partial [Anaerococcus hydrogenalis]|nr:FMN-binding protein [Anaerococcus hydrogenalis]